MSEIYVNEPATKGKVILHTSHGELEIDLWSRECPMACKNFVQLCMEGYYDRNIFHRIIKDFLVQTGDPTGSGKGGSDTIYGGHYADEFHSRLRYRYRGLVGVANLGRGTNTNGNQFFITLTKADGLNNESTLFGKVVGKTIFNLLRIGECETNAHDRPISPPFIKHTEVVINPFEDSIILRNLKEITDQKAVEECTTVKDVLKKKKTNLLSFQEDEEDEEHFINLNASKSAHDLLSDARLLKQKAYDINTEEQKEKIHLCKEDLKKRISNIQEERNNLENSITKDDTYLEDIKICKEAFDNNDKAKEEEQEEEKQEEEKQEEGKEEKNKKKKKLKKEILTFKKGQGSVKQVDFAKDRITDADILSEYEKKRRLYLIKKNDKVKRNREANVLASLEEFDKKLKSMILEGKEKETQNYVNKVTDDLNNSISSLANFDEAINPSDRSWLYGSGLKFAIDSNRAYEMDAAKDALEVYDPLASKKNDDGLRKIKNLRMKPSMKRDKEISTW